VTPKLPTSREVALLAGASRYFNGVPCPKGHVAPRRVNNGSCITCASETHKKYQQKPEVRAVKYKRVARWRETPAAKEKIRKYSRDQIARLKQDPVKYAQFRHEANMRRQGVCKEIVVEKRLVEAVERLGGFCPKFKDLSRRGAPDRIVMLLGHPVYFVELKRPRRGVVAVHQANYHAEIRRCGQHVFVLNSTEEVDEFMKRFSLV
jgi:hypothetical protein